MYHCFKKKGIDVQYVEIQIIHFEVMVPLGYNATHTMLTKMWRNDIRVKTS